MITKLFLCASMLMLADGQATQQKPPPKTGQKIAQKADHAVQTQPQSPMPPEMLEKEVNGVRLAAIEANLVKYTNEERVRYGLPPLVVDKELMESAREHTAWMSRQARWSTATRWWPRTSPWASRTAATPSRPG